MLTKYILTIGSTDYDVPDECLANWDDISFSLKRTDYSGVMRSYSTEFVFVGETRDLLWAAYLADGFHATASIAVYTLTDTHEWEMQHEAELDFSTIEYEKGKLTMNAIDNTLAASLKSMKGQKWEYAVSSFDTKEVTVERVDLSSEVRYNFLYSDNLAGIVNVRKDEGRSVLISEEYFSPVDESSGRDGTAINRFFMSVNKNGATLTVKVQGYVRCFLCPLHYGLGATGTVPVAALQFGYWDEDNSYFQLWREVCNDDITQELRYGSWRNKWIGKSTHANYASLDALKAAAAANTDIIGLYPGYFGIVGENAYGTDEYWTGNHVYEYYGNTWRDRGLASEYKIDRFVSVTSSLPEVITTHYPMLWATEDIVFMGGIMYATWTDPERADIDADAVTPLQLISRVVDSISPGATVSIADDAAGVLADTYLVAAEELRKIPGSKMYTTFQQFVDFMEAVFGYTYRIEGNEVQFVHRSEVFATDSVKVIDSYRDFKFSVNDNLIYTEVDAGYGKKEYGEIDGRLETNFTNYYATGYDVTDKKLSLISKYRADTYGIEFTARKSEAETKDDRSDDDIFIIQATMDDGQSYTYDPDDNVAFAPAVCVANNAGFIAAMGNGAQMTLTMTSSDGNNSLVDITIYAGTALFTAGEIEFSTDDMDEPADINGLVQLDHNGFRYRGFISEARSRYGRRNGMDYTLIVKDITTI